MWARLDDGYFRHRKNRAAGKDGRALDVAGICWSSGQGTDGFIADTDLELIAAEAGVKPAVASKLVTVGRWTRGDRDGEAGFWIHDFLDFNPSAEEVAERKRQRSEAGRKGGLKSKPPGSKSEANASAGASADGRAEAEAERKQNGTPSPIPLRESIVQTTYAGPLDESDPFVIEATRRTRAQSNVRDFDGYRRKVLAQLHGEGWTPPNPNFVPGTGALKPRAALPEVAAPIPESLKRANRHGLAGGGVSA